MYDPDVDAAPTLLAEPPTDLTAPQNKVLETGAWTQSIIWSPCTPFRDFTQLELNDEDIFSEERPSGKTLSSPSRTHILTTPQAKISCGHERDLGQITSPGIGSTFPTTNSTRSAKKVAGIVSVRHSVSLSLSTHIPPRSFSCHSYALVSCPSFLSTHVLSRLVQDAAV